MRAVGPGPACRSLALLDEWALWLEIWVRALRDPDARAGARSPGPRWSQTLADIIRDGRSTGEFTTDELDAEDVALQLGTMIDGLAIQVLLNDTIVSPERMARISLDSAERLLGYRS